MGILRSDRVSGLGGANAINGSVFFDGATIITVNDSDDFHYGTGDFTVEGWIYATGRDQQMMLIGQWDGNAGASGTISWALQLTNDTNGYLRFLISTDTSSVAFNQNASSGSVFDNSWHHFAVTRNGNDYNFFLDGTVVKSFTDSAAIGNATVPLTIGGSSRAYTGGTAPNQMFTGYLSNIRITKGEAVYTAAFTAPTNRLEKTSNTILLCCQSPGNILKEEVGKVLGVNATNTNNKGPSASRFTPDLGEDYGTTFADGAVLDTLSYMVPPGGTTTQRGRGRGLLMGGAVSPGATNTTQIKYFDIASQGITDDFGQTTVARRSTGSLSSSTRGLMGGGFVAPTSPAHTVSDVIDYVTIATTANATDFGNMQSTGYSYGTASNETRGLFAGGYRPNNSAVVNTIDLITISTTGNASNFGDLVVARRGYGGLASPTRGIFMGGAPSTKEEIDYVTIATAGDATDFGNLTDGRDHVYGGSSSTRGVMGGGRTPSNTNIIDYITIATIGNATDFGDLLSATYYNAATSNGSRLVWVGNTGITNTMEYVTIATTGNSIDWGDQGGTTQHSGGACSDSHGGIA